MTGYSQARIALLEGERRSFENVKLDLMRRIKMLEYALRMERCAVVLRTQQHLALTCLRAQLQTTHSTSFAERPTL